MKCKYSIRMRREIFGVTSFYVGALAAIASIIFATKTCAMGDHRPLWGGGLAFACYMAGTLFLGSKPTNWRFVLPILLLLPVIAWQSGWALSFFFDYMADGWPVCGTLTSMELEPDEASGGIILTWVLSCVTACLGLGLAFCRMTKE